MPRQADHPRDPQPAVGPRGALPQPSGPLANVDDLLAAAGHGDLAALGAFYDHTAPAVFGLLRGALGDPARAAHATERVYRRLWRVAPRFDPAAEDAFSLLLRTARRELIGPLGDLARRRGADHDAAPGTSSNAPNWPDGRSADPPGAGASAP